MTIAATRDEGRFTALDGLRGVAALGVLLYHIADWSGRRGHFAHGYLAVDFFFCLSGFVLAHAFEQRRMGFGKYLVARWVRVWPMLAIATVAGALLTGKGDAETWIDFAKGLLLIPKFAPMEAGTFPSLFPFNPLAWSLCLEVLVSLAWYPFRRAPDMAVIMFILLAGAALLFVAIGMGGLQTGWDQATFGLGVLRAAFPFAIGWMCWRHRAAFTARKTWLPAALLLVVLVVPVWPSPVANGLYDFACSTLLFPVLVLLGAYDPGGRLAKLCERLGGVSYPLYALHWAFWYVMISIYPDGWKRDLPLWFCVLAFFVLPTASWTAWRWVETPLRDRLKRLTGT